MASWNPTELAEFVLRNSTLAAAFQDPASETERVRTSFQWGGTISASFLLVLNQNGRRLPMQTTFLLAYMFISTPALLFTILRTQFGYWIGFLAVASNLLISFPQPIPVSRLLMFIVTPDWLAIALRNSFSGGLICLAIGVSVVVTEITAIGESRNWNCSLHCLGYCIAIGFLFFFTVLYLSLGAWQ
ncbi:unnamed protein product [Linum trigynum]|uniref:Uncharacterized protein n=1 Tax=Linum trigynum TaxID=586398 RepID=A0AAV2GFE7_9ROSI